MIKTGVRRKIYLFVILVLILALAILRKLPLCVNHLEMKKSWYKSASLSATSVSGCRGIGKPLTSIVLWAGMSLWVKLRARQKSNRVFVVAKTTQPKYKHVHGLGMISIK